MAPPSKEDTSSRTDPFLASIDAKISALQALRASYIAARSVGAYGSGGDVDTAVGASSISSLGSTPMELPRGALLGKSLPNAIKLYLSAVKRKQTLKEIAAALKEGGVETTAANFEAPISSAINRLKASGEVLRFNDGWALAEFYPESLRSKLSEKDGKAAKKRVAKKAKKTSKKSASKDSQAGADENQATGGETVDARILAYMKLHQGQGFTGATIAEHVAGVNSTSAAMAFARLARYKKISKQDDGSYRAS